MAQQPLLAAAATFSTPSSSRPPNTSGTPSSTSSSNNTFLMASTPVRNRKNLNEGYKPRIITTVGAKPACLVNASVTYVGNDQIYAFGGFDQYTDEVYNHVLMLNLQSRQWKLVDNYGDIPGVRMGHTANLWRGDKLLVFGGENEHRTYLSDVIIFDLKTAHWTQPEISGPTPKGRARHSAVINDEKLYILGGLSGHDNHVLEDICYLDLRTWTWSRSWRFVPRYDHTSWIWNNKIWVFGGLGEDIERTSEIWWLDLRGSPVFDSPMAYGTAERQLLSARYPASPATQQLQGISSTGYIANSSSVQTNPNSLVSRNAPVAPGCISSLKFISSPNLPNQVLGTHFHVFSSGCLLDFVTPGMTAPFETSLSALDLDSLRWQKLADGKDLFNPNYRWHYCALNEEGTHAWLLGCPAEGVNNSTVGEYLSDVLPIDLRKMGILGNAIALENSMRHTKIPASDANTSSYLSGIGADLAKTFDQALETGSGADFIITAIRDEDVELMDDMTAPTDPPLPPSQPIHVHRLILQARWPHFQRMWNAQMSEFHTKKLHIPEPYSSVRAFLYYLYTDSIAPSPAGVPTLAEVAGMLVMSNLYDMARLRLLCVNRLGKELDVENAAIIWEHADRAGEEWLRRRAAAFVMLHWGRVVRTEGFRSLKRASLMELCEEVDAEGRVVGGDELEAIGGLGGVRLGMGGGGFRPGKRSATMSAGEEGDDEGDGDDDGMELS